VAQKKVDRRAVCEHHLRKLLLNNAILVLQCYDTVGSVM